MDGMEDGMMGHVSGVVQEQAGVEGSKKTLKGTYIVRVGWDDVRGWLGEVSGQAWGVVDTRELELMRTWVGGAL